MCHPEVPAGQEVPEVAREEVAVPLPGGEALPSLLTLPDRPNGGGVLVINDVYGRTPFYEQLAARLAGAGFVALQPEFFFREGALAERSREAAMARRGRLDERRALADLTAALDWLRARPEVTAPRLGTIGFCMGGTFVLNLAAQRDDLASVCFYGFPSGGRGRPGGPAVRGPRPLDPEELDRTSGPILGFWGDQDAGVGMDNVAAYAAALKERGVDFQHTVYPGLGHGYMAASELDPDKPAYEAASESWTRTLAFFDKHLTATPAA